MIKVNKEIAERLNYMESDHRYSNDSILEQHSKGWSLSENECLNELRLSELAECLLLGYEVELTNEEQILEDCNNISIIPSTDEYISGYKEGYLDATKSVLNKYNIKIEGINA